ncbi:hypothetical protein KAJ27_24450, partial [bacterium]|nr:hypothetical protein [bacterium]
MKKINNIKVKILTFLMILVFINSMSCFLLGIGGLGGSNSGSNSVLKKNFSPWICPYCGGKYALLIKSVHLVHCTNKKSVNTQNPVTTPVNTQSPGSIIGNNSSGFIQSNTTGWTMKAAPSPTENYTVIITGPARVWENIKSKGQTIGWQNNPVPYSGSTGYPLKAWIFTLPPATGTEISLSFYGEKTFDIPYSNQTSITSSKQIAWITKTFPIVKKIKLPVPIVGSRTYDVITPPGIVQEDVKCSWTIDNPSDIFLKLDTYVEYEWSFPNPPGSPLIKRGRIKVDKNTSTKVLGLKLRASHVFKEAGIYDISLNLKFTEVIQNGDKIEEVLRNYDYMKSVIVVEHIPEYIGNVLASISPPIIVKEDIDNLFLFKTMFTFTKKLPENMCTLVDRFEGVEPGTITYSIDWGDGEVSPKIDYPNTEKTLIGDNPIPAVRYIKIEGVTHNYLEPGNYTVRLLITYYEKHYEEYPIKSDTGQIIGYDYKLIGPFTHIATKNITVWDQTPPVIVNGSFSDLEATSGDPLEIKLEVSDNHPSEAITSAKIHFMLYPAQWNGDDAPEEWKKIDANLESIGNSTWLISGKVDIPVDFATKKFAGNTL